MNAARTILCLLVSQAPLVTAQAQNRIASGDIQELYSRECASCHGQTGEGGLGGSLVDDQWRIGASDEDIARAIREGAPELGMPAYGETLGEKQIRSLVVYIRELRHKASPPPPEGQPQAALASQLHDFQLERLIEFADDSFWSIDFLPDGTMLLSGFSGGVYLARDGGLDKVVGTPEVWRHGQGGMLDVVAHPEYRENRWVYLSFADSDDGGQTGSTRIVRGRIEGGEWRDQQDIYTTPAEFHTGSGVHFGCRIVFRDGHLFFPIGDRGRMHNAQRLDNPFGKVHRLHDDGRVPEDNPFTGRDDALPTIWCYGNRNPQGLALHPRTGELWETEHGPRGGDELNLIRRGENYGWPVVTHGINYNGTPITGRTAAPGMRQPATHWTPSIAVCGMDFYHGDAFPRWRDHVFVGGLASRQLHRLELDGGRVVAEEVVMKAPGRVRDIRNGPDGYLYLAINQGRGSDGRVYRLLPAR